MDFEHILALGILGSYFAIIFFLFYLIISSLLQQAAGKWRTQSTVFAALSVLSFAYTWYYMLQFIAWSFIEYEANAQSIPLDRLQRISNWLVDTALFEQAWAAVSMHPLNWWWSEQLCILTAGTWTVFLATEGTHDRVKYVWAYMLLGQVVAISVAANLFFVALTLTGTNRLPMARQASPTVYISVFASLATIAVSPYTSRSLFLPNLLVMHALLVVPLVFTKPWPEDVARSENKGRKLSFTRLSSSGEAAGITFPAGFPKLKPYHMALDDLYGSIAVVSVLLRVRTILSAGLIWYSPGEWFTALSATLFSHPAQSSIGWDVVWSTLSFFIWLPKPTILHFIMEMSVMTVFSVGVSAPLFLWAWAYRSYYKRAEGPDTGNKLSEDEQKRTEQRARRVVVDALNSPR